MRASTETGRSGRTADLKDAAGCVDLFRMIGGSDGRTDGKNVPCTSWVALARVVDVRLLLSGGLGALRLSVCRRGGARGHPAWEIRRCRAHLQSLEKLSMERKLFAGNPGSPG